MSKQPFVIRRSGSDRATPRPWFDQRSQRTCDYAAICAVLCSAVFTRFGRPVAVRIADGDPRMRRGVHRLGQAAAAAARAPARDFARSPRRTHHRLSAPRPERWHHGPSALHGRTCPWRPVVTDNRPGGRISSPWRARRPHHGRFPTIQAIAWPNSIAFGLTGRRRTYGKVGPSDRRSPGCHAHVPAAIAAAMTSG